MTMVTATISSSRQATSRVAHDGYKLVLVADDDRSYREALSSGLAQEGFAVEAASSGDDALRLFQQIRPDLVLLDMTLPDQSGIALCQQIRSLRTVPVIIVTARDTEFDIVSGLQHGASDYVVKPFRLRELVARMRAVLRRAEVVSEDHEEILNVGPVHLNADRREVAVLGVPVELSRKEFDLLALLMSHSGQVVPRDGCIDRLWWDKQLSDTRTLDTHIKRLRQKIEPDPANPSHLVTVRGVGFRFEA
jgi:two-component system response regulator RegX3